MAENYVPNVGNLVEGVGRRDAIHVAVAPVVAGHDMDPGDHVGIRDKKATYHTKLVGIVDPFYRHTVKKGETFWLFLYPGTISSLRHVWSHFAFPTSLSKEEVIDEVSNKRISGVFDK